MYRLIKLLVTIMQALTDLWSRTLAEVEVDVSRANFLTLFKRTSLLSLEDGVATIAAPSTMIIDLLQRRFHDTIKKALDKHANADTKIIFVPKSIEITPKQKNSDSLFTEDQEPKALIGHLPRVRPDFTFTNIAVSSSNQLAYVSASTVAKKPGASYNPFFIYGPVGVGKTHLMQAIANDVYEKNPNRKIVYTTSEEFTNEVVEAIRTNSTSFLKKKFRDLDLLLLDDVQFLAGKERVQEELFHTFNILVDKGAQIVLSSDRPPQEMARVEKRLLSRFSGGLTVDIEAPGFELRCAIILIKAKKYSISLPIEVAKIIAETITDTRALEGALLKIMTISETSSEEISPEMAKRILLNKKEQTPASAEELIKNVCVFYNVRESQIKGEKRDALLVRARQVAMFILKRETLLTYKEIGGLLGGRDHTTIMYGVEKIEKVLESSPSFGETLGISKITGQKIVD